MNKKEGRKYMKIILVCVYLVLTISGLIFMKLGGNPGTVSVRDGSINMAMNLLSGVGFVCYICSFLLFTRIVVMFDLSYIFPICTGIVQVVTLIASYYVFKEKISMYGILGASLIIIGLIIMNLKFDNKKEFENTAIAKITQESIDNNKNV